MKLFFNCEGCNNWSDDKGCKLFYCRPSLKYVVKK